jgi:signal transduction histidine kinase
MTPEFQKALLRLTGLYVLILMILAFICSVWLLGVAGREISTTLDLAGPGAQITTGVEDIGEHSRQRLQHSLIFFNVFVFGAGTLASYLLAKRTLRTIEQNNRAQQEFVTDASHELRTPLTALKTELQLAQRQAKTLTASDYKAVIGSALEEVVRLSALSERLLQLASAPLESTNATSSLGAALSAARKQLRQPITAKQLKVTLLSADIDLQISRDDLVEVLVIILDNAIRYSPKNSEIALNYSVRGEFVLITIQDQGPGINPDDLPYIFDRFYKGKTKKSIPDNGHGIGLSVARKIVLAAGGNIQADDQPKTGASISIKLRIARSSV